jgi:hypothetical protein
VYGALQRLLISCACIACCRTGFDSPRPSPVLSHFFPLPLLFLVVIYHDLFEGGIFLAGKDGSHKILIYLDNVIVILSLS